MVFSGRSQSIQLQWAPELEWISPAMGMLPLVFTFLPRQPLVTGDDGERYVAKLEGFPAFSADWIERLRNGAWTGIVPSRTQVTATLDLLRGWLSGPLSGGVLAGQAHPTQLDAAGAETWIDTVRETLDRAVAPALENLRTALETVTLPAARTDERPGLLYLDDGADLYEQLVGANTSLDVSAREVHDLGLAQIDRLADEYRTVAGPVLGTDRLEEIFDRLRDDPELHYRDADTLVADATAILARAGDALDGWFGITPNAPCTANAIGQGALAFYSQPSRDGSQPGQFFFNTSDPSMWGTFQLEAVTFHEGIPGHHLQMAIAQEKDDLHRLLSDYYISAYNEGWGLYTERLADEMGLYSSDLDRIGMLSADSMRACRLVVDTGIHALGWSRSRAIDYMVANSPMTRQQVSGEIDRYIGKPGQALGYMMGRLEIDAIRSEAEARLADRFDITAFHDTVLSTGSVPLSTLRRVVDEWIASSNG
jgi:uncharacterized protein (DUF885 family)